MTHTIDAVNKTPVEQFLIALHAGDMERVRTLLEDHAEVRATVNEPRPAISRRQSGCSSTRANVRT